jgi:hypothetical protein
MGEVIFDVLNYISVIFVYWDHHFNSSFSMALIDAEYTNQLCIFISFFDGLSKNTSLSSLSVLQGLVCGKS